MRPVLKAGLVLLVATFAGCGPVMSLYPLVRARDAILVDGLAGQWRASDSTVYALTPSGTTYALLGEGADSTECIELRFVRLGGRLFADVSRPGAGGDLTVHFVARARAERDSLVLDLLDEGWVSDHRGGWWGRLRAESPEGQFVLTEGTAGLQRFVRRHADARGAFTDWLRLGREP